MPDQELAGYTSWRNRQPEYDHSGLPNPLKIMVDFYRTHQPADWSYRLADRMTYESIYGSDALTHLDLTGMVAENDSPVWVFNVQEAAALELKAQGKAFGHDPIYRPTEDHSNDVLVQGPMGPPVYVPASSITFGSLTVANAKGIIAEVVRKIVQEEIAKATGKTQ
jgi:hypothetical protein